MKKAIFIILALICIWSCKERLPEPGYIVQVSLGGWNSPDNSAECIISRLEAVEGLINVDGRKITIINEDELKNISRKG